ncbi:hypothetical protein KIL84_014155 [Mauremys mutica]|uniref:Uncharacterized protein n=1 Tax=Mauremys mutica TaxID=74926 RepID=A0A9D4B819_9SAUR|nr:hypothetical protein KIL84_014155 [Mauremys mutica]
MTTQTYPGYRDFLPRSPDVLLLVAGCCTQLTCAVEKVLVASVSPVCASPRKALPEELKAAPVSHAVSEFGISP